MSFHFLRFCITLHAVYFSDSQPSKYLIGFSLYAVCVYQEVCQLQGQTTKRKQTI